MTQIFKDGLAIPASVIAIDEGNIVTQVRVMGVLAQNLQDENVSACMQNNNKAESEAGLYLISIALQVKTEATDGYNSVQVGYNVCKETRITKPELNHLRKAGAPAMKHLVEFRVSLIQELQVYMSNNLLSDV